MPARPPKGTAARKGCPEEVKKEIVEKVNYAAHRIQFHLGKSDLVPASHTVLNEVVKILKQNPGSLFRLKDTPAGTLLTMPI